MELADRASTHFQGIIVQTQTLQSLQVGNGRGDRLHPVVAEDQRLQPLQLPDRRRHLPQTVAAQVQHFQATEYNRTSYGINSI